MKERKAYVILVCISIIGSIVAVLISANQANSNERKFCDVVQAVISKPVPKPADPKANPSREQSYEFYLKFVTLHHRLGC